MTMGMWMYFWDTLDWGVSAAAGRGRRDQKRRRRGSRVPSILEIMKDKRANTEEMMKAIRRNIK